MSDLPAKLRRIAGGALEFPDDEAVVLAAAETIARMAKALEPFAKIANAYEMADARRTQNRRDEMGGSYVYRTEDSNRVSISMRECRSARTALTSDHCDLTKAPPAG